MPFFFHKGHPMFYLLIFLAAIAIALLKLGALSVWFTVLSVALTAMAVIAVAVAICALWRRFKSRATQFIALRKP
jgi:hypothetical protein